jgi:hypothetical protein
MGSGVSQTRVDDVCCEHANSRNGCQTGQKLCSNDSEGARHFDPALEGEVLVLPLARCQATAVASCAENRRTVFCTVPTE